MNTLLKVSTILVACTVSLSASGQGIPQKENRIRVVCVGDSITYGARLKNPGRDSYPAKLQELLGPGYRVINLGVGSCTLIRKGRPNVWNQLPKIAAARPNMIVVSLGTNDTCGGRRKCWSHKDDFPGDCRDLLDTLLALPSKPRVWICAPSPMMLETPRLPSSRKKALRERKPRLQELITVIRKVAGEKEVGFIDLNTPLADKPHLFTEKDGVHPNIAGYGAIAELVYAELCNIIREPIRQQSPDSMLFSRFGSETLTRIEEDLRVPGTSLYAEYGTPNGNRGSKFGRFSFVWPAGFQLRALAAAAELDSKRYRERLTDFADALQKYWRVVDGVGGYMVLTAKSERFYDDNAWLVLGLLDTYRITREQRFLDRAVETMDFLFEGARTTHGGGIRQKEAPGGTFTCTTAPATVGALRLFNITEDPRYLKSAQRWYAWLTSPEVGVQDPKTGLYHQGARLEDGKWKVKKGYRAYQSALPIQAALLLYKITGKNAHLAEAKRVASSCLDRWIEPSGAFRETGQWGGSDLVQALLQLSKTDDDPKWYRAVKSVLTYLHSRCRDPKGRYGEYWHEDRRNKPLDRFKLLYMAPVAQAYWLAASYQAAQ